MTNRKGGDENLNCFCDFEGFYEQPLTNENEDVDDDDDDDDNDDDDNDNDDKVCV